MKTQQPMETVAVECYSGGRFAERPVEMMWRGERLHIASVERAWQTPGGMGFVVCAADSRHFELAYTIAGDRWTARQLTLDA
jgi:hypothetical protein